MVTRENQKVNEVYCSIYEAISKLKTNFTCIFVDFWRMFHGQHHFQRDTTQSESKLGLSLSCSKINIKDIAKDVDSLKKLLDMLQDK